MIFTIAKQTFKEIYESKILINVILLGAFISLTIFITSEFTYGAAARVGLDVGLGVLSLSLTGISIFLGANLIDNEIKNRTLYLVLCRPVSRIQFYIGKMLGLVGILLANTISLSLFVFILYFFVGGEYHYLIPWSVFFIFLESVVVLSLVVFLSLISNTIITVLMSLTIYAAGHGVESVKETTLFKSSTLLSYFIDGYSIFMPNFSKFNIKSFVLYDNLITNSFLVGSSFYALVWILLIGLFSSYIMNKKDFT